MHQVVITGFGIVSCLGTGVSAVEAALREGRSGIVVDPARAGLGFRSPLTGAITDFTPPAIDALKNRTLPLFGLHALAAALEAVEMAGWDEEVLRGAETGLIVGNDANSTVIMGLCASLGMRGALWTVSGGGHAIGQAADLIAQGRQDAILCGGVQEINGHSLRDLDAAGAFPLRVDDPAAASRPFDAGRDGMIPSGGAAMLTLETLDHAMRRGAEIFGYVHSYGFSADGADPASPTEEGLARAMADCLSRGEITPDKVDYICAHAASMIDGDAAEARAIAGVFGAVRPWVSSTKSLTGHEMAMAGAAQVVYSMLMGRGGFIARNANFGRQEDGAPPLRIAAETIAETPYTILCNSAEFGGSNACLLIGIEA